MNEKPQKEFDDVLKRMLSTPPDPHKQATKSAKSKPKKKPA